MAVGVKMSNDNLLFFKKLGLTELAEKAQSLGAMFSFGFFEVRALHKNSHDLLAKTTILVSVLAVLKGSVDEAMLEASRKRVAAFLVQVNGMLETQKASLKEAPTKGMIDLLGDHLDTPPVKVSDKELDVIFDALTGHYSQKEPAKKAPVKPPKAKKPEAEKPEAKKHTLIDLKAATKLLEPVHGTSPNSTYYTIARSPRFNLAARLWGDCNLSLRVEGDLSQFDEDVLMSFGLTPKDGGKYWSVHFEMTSNPKAREKIVGALLFDDDLDFTERVESLKELL